MVNVWSQTVTHPSTIQSNVAQLLRSNGIRCVQHSIAHQYNGCINIRLFIIQPHYVSNIENLNACLLLWHGGGCGMKAVLWHGGGTISWGRRGCGTMKAAAWLWLWHGGGCCMLLAVALWRLLLAAVALWRL